MTVRVVVEAGAKFDVLEAAAWYEGERLGLGTEFLDDIEHVLARIGENPLQFPAVYLDARRALARRFPYSIYFRVAGATARIKAVLHQHRDPDALKSRVERDG